MTTKKTVNAKKELDATVGEIERKIKSLKTLNIPQIDWKLYALLRRLGLTKYEILAYVALVEAGKPLSVSELIGKESKTGIPQPRAYDVLGSLIKYGLVEEAKTSKKAKLYRTIPPEEGLENLMRFFVYAKETALKKLKQLEGTKQPHYGGVWEIVRQDNIVSAIKRIILKAENEILIVGSVELIKKIAPTLKEAHDKKRLIISVVLHKKRDFVNQIWDWAQFMRIRFRSSISMPYLITDRGFAIQWGVKTFSSSSNDVRQIIENREIIATLIDHFFFSNWKNSEILPYERPRIYPIKTVHIQTAVDEINSILDKKQTAQVIVEGYSKAGEKTRLKAKVIRTEANWNTGIFSVFLDSKISVGGMLATAEDVSAERIMINAE
ncbi:MAG: TrmB family transcriptional regulator [Candidatus Hodarchaeota archaeon]